MRDVNPQFDLMEKRQKKMKRLEVEAGELGDGDGGWKKKKRTRGDGGAKERKKRGIRQAETSCKKGWQGEATRRESELWI